MDYFKAIADTADEARSRIMTAFCMIENGYSQSEVLEQLVGAGCRLQTIANYALAQKRTVEEIEADLDRLCKKQKGGKK